MRKNKKIINQLYSLTNNLKSGDFVRNKENTILGIISKFSAPGYDNLEKFILENNRNPQGLKEFRDNLINIQDKVIAFTSEGLYLGPVGKLIKTKNYDFDKLIAKYLGSEYKFTGKIIVKKRGIRRDSILYVEICHIPCMKVKLRKKSDIKDQRGCAACGWKKKIINKNDDIIQYKKIPLTHWNSIYRGATSRNLEFEITMEYASNLLVSQNMKCALSGVDICFGSSSAKSKNTNHIDTTASLDRIDSSKGYIEGNVQWVHKMINLMKWSNSNSEFITWCQTVTEHNYEKKYCGITISEVGNTLHEDIWVS